MRRSKKNKKLKNSPSWVFILLAVVFSISSGVLPPLIIDLFNDHNLISSYFLILNYACCIIPFFCSFIGFKIIGAFRQCHANKTKNSELFLEILSKPVDSENFIRTRKGQGRASPVSLECSRRISEEKDHTFMLHCLEMFYLIFISGLFCNFGCLIAACRSLKLISGNCWGFLASAFVYSCLILCCFLWRQANKIAEDSRKHRERIEGYE